MAIIGFPIAHPSTPGFSSINWQSESAVASQESPFSFVEKVYTWSGERRKVTVNLPPMTLAQAKEWIAFIHKLNGIEGTFFLRDTVGAAPLGNVSGTGLVKTADQTGQELATKDWPISVTDLFKAGDWVSMSDGTIERAYTILLDVSSDVNGDATLHLWPKIRTAYSIFTEIEWGPDWRGHFRLTDFPENGWDVNRLMSGFSFSAKEVF